MEKKILDLIEEKEQWHRKKYKEFCEMNPGYIMNGHLIIADTCKEIIDDIKTSNYNKYNVTINKNIKSNK